MRYEEGIDINAPVADVWPVLTDVERWPEWSASMRKVERLGRGPLAQGSRVRITQPRLPAVVWEVSAVVAGRGFEWRNASPGMTTVANHELTPLDDGGCRLLLSLTQAGLLAGPMRLLFGGLTRRYMRMEAEGPKRRCEGSA